MAFVAAGSVVFVTVVVAFVQAYAAVMSSRPGAKSGAGWTLGIGLPIAALITASHWFHPIGW